jgi:DNA-binding NtrC family response regulator
MRPMTSSLSAPGTRILESADGQPTLVVNRARLVVVAGPDAGAELDFDGLSITVGTEPDAGLALRDPAVSGRHFELVRTEHGCFLRDDASTNGTFVDGRRATGVYLGRSAEIHIGETTLHFESLDEDVELPLSRRTNFGKLLGHSPAMRAAFAILRKAAKSDVTVLLQGESGTGKELAARGLHEEGARKDAPYVVFDCGTAAPSLLESQLFGHEKGAFTGATSAREGVFEAADGGTLVLDEIGELPLDLQPKLLRALESRTVVRLGSTASRTVDARFVASTNRNLRAEVAAGRFREDLFFRLSVITVRLPPLRDRKEELPRLIRHFLSELGRGDAPEVPPATMRLLESYDWPGNVREVRNFVERFLALPGASPEQLLPRADLGVDAPELEASELSVPFHDAKQRFTDRFERAYLERLLEAHGDNMSEAARVSGLSRQSCYRLLRKHGLRS